MLMSDWHPLEWEVSVDDFLSPAVSRATRAVCMMMAAKPVTFVNPQLPRLADVLQLVLGVVPTQPQIEWSAWYLGMWLTEGDAMNESVTLPGLPGAHHVSVSTLIDGVSGW